MARSQDTVYYKTFYARIRNPKNEKPIIETKRREDDDYVLKKGETRDEDGYIVFNDRWVEGILVNAKIGGYHWEEKNEWVDVIEILLRDHETREDVRLTCTLSKLGLELLNALFNIEEFGLIRIAVYEDKEGYAKVSVNNNGEWAGFKINYQDYESLIRKYEGRGGKLERDFTAVNKFFKEHFEAIFIPKLKEYLFTHDVSPLPEGTPYEKPKKKNATAHDAAIPDEYKSENYQEREPEPTAPTEQFANDLPFDKKENNDLTSQVNPEEIF